MLNNTTPVRVEHRGLPDPPPPSLAPRGRYPSAAGFSYLFLPHFAAGRLRGRWQRCTPSAGARRRGWAIHLSGLAHPAARWWDPSWWVAQASVEWSVRGSLLRARACSLRLAGPGDVADSDRSSELVGPGDAANGSRSGELVTAAVTACGQVLLPGHRCALWVSPADGSGLPGWMDSGGVGRGGGIDGLRRRR